MTDNPYDMKWLSEHYNSRPYRWESTGVDGDVFDGRDVLFSRTTVDEQLLLSDKAFNSHEFNDGKHVSPYDTGRVDYGVDNLEVRLLQGIDEAQFSKTLRRAIRATNGIDPAEPEENTDPEEMLKGGLQTALETQVVIFEIIGASRVLTHQLVRSRRAAFHQQSQRATWYGERPNQRWPMSLLKMACGTDSNKYHVEKYWRRALLAAWDAYKAACTAGMSYQDARYILPEGTTNYILCEYPLREFINMFAYRGCSMFQWEMVQAAREMRRVLLEAHPFLEPYVKISCEKALGECSVCQGTGRKDLPDGCPACGGDGKARKCTFQGWENVDRQCDFPWARQNNRVFLPSPRNRIG